MARIVLTSWGSHGDVFPYLGLALELKRRGHDPVLATSAHFGPMIEEVGIAFRAVRPDLDPTDGVMVARAMDPWQAAEMVQELIMRNIRDSYADLDAAVEGADLLLTHPVTLAGPLVAEQRRMKWMATVLAPISLFSVYETPVPPHAPWMRHLNALGPVWGRLMRSLARAMTRRWCAPVDRLRRELGLPDRGHPMFEGQFSPYASLGLFSPLLGAPQRDWPPHMQATGFVFYNGPGALDQELEAFLSRGPAPVVFTLGSLAVHAAGTFYEESIAALRDSGLRGVLLAGASGVARLAPHLSQDMLAVAFAPHQLLFPRAAAIVHQGGAGTTAQALRSGRPTLIVPHANDQPDNAYRVERLGCSRTLLPRHYGGARVAGELAALLNRRSYAARADAVAHQVRAENGTVRAADAVERLLAQSAVQPRNSAARRPGSP